MFFQRVLALYDKAISEIFWLQSWGDGGESDGKGKNRWIYLVDVGHKKIGVVGVDGKIHTTMRYWAARHYYDGKKLLKRIPVRKDLKEGERLATQEEIAQHQVELRERFAGIPGGGMS